MSDRFINVFSLTPNLHTAGCPIIVEAGALLKDTETGNMIAQLKMKNIGEETIVSCKVSLKAFENNGAEVEGVKDYSYLDLSAAAGEEFGGKTPVFLPVDITRSFTVRINEIVFEDKTSLSFDAFELKALPTQEAVLDSDKGLADQYRRETSERSKFKPIEYEDLWICACGGINRKNAEKCATCDCTKEKVFGSLDEEYLKSKKEEYDKARAAEQQQREKEEAEHKEKVRKTAKKTMLVIAIIAIAAALAIAGFFVYKHVSTNNAYNEAIETGKAGEYEKAIKQLETIDPYKDSTKYINTFKADIVIENADNYISEGDYESVTSAAAGVDSSILPSKEQKALDQICNYAEALSLLDVDSSSYLDGANYNSPGENVISTALDLLEKADGYGSSGQIKKMISDNTKYMGKWEGTAWIERERFHKEAFSSGGGVRNHIFLKDHDRDGFDDETGEMIPSKDWDCEAEGMTRIGIKKKEGNSNNPTYETVIRVEFSFDSRLYSDYCDYYEGEISADDVKDFKIKGANDYEDSDYASMKIDDKKLEGKTKNEATIKLKKQ